MRLHQRKREKAFLVCPSGPGRTAARDSGELKKLCATAGAEIMGLLELQVREINPATWLSGHGVERVREEIARTGSDLVVLDCELKPSQASNLEESLKIRVISRTELILDIFAQHATTSEAALQVESAQLQYLLPRLSGKGVEMSRLGAGIGTRGPGETKLETDRRHIRRRMTVLKKKLAEIEERRELLRAGRKEKTASLVGYTNAGKSTLLNLLAKEEFKAVDALFVTLDPVIRKVWLAEGKTLFLSDTVGFISHLPHHLVASFRATLGEVASSSFLVHLVDASDPDPEGKMRVVGEILAELGAREKPELIVFNKCDQAEEGSLERLRATWPQAVFVSAKTGEGIAELKTMLLEFSQNHFG